MFGGWCSGYGITYWRHGKAVEGTSFFCGGEQLRHGIFKTHQSNETERIKLQHQTASPPRFHFVMTQERKKQSNAISEHESMLRIP